MRKIYLLLVTLIPVLTQAQVFDVETIKRAGPNNERINFVFLPDGYTEDELQKFRQDAIKVTQEMFGNDFFEQYSDFINVHLIYVPSNESGADNPGTARDDNPDHPVQDVDNYFGSTFDYGGIDRALFARFTWKIASVLASNIPNYDEAIVLVNTPYYGGTGGQFATVSTHEQATEITIHEIGHTFANLADEYDYPGGFPRERANVTQETRREFIRWNAWIEDSTPIPTPEIYSNIDLVGLFEGAAYNPFDWYRPKLYCKMQSLGDPFCEVCTEAFIQQFHNKVEAVWKIGPKGRKVVSGEEDVEFSVGALGLGKLDYTFEWQVNGKKIQASNEKLVLKFDDRKNTTNSIQVIVRDDTDKVRIDPISYTLSWTVQGNLMEERTAEPEGIQSLTLINARSDRELKKLKPLDTWFLPDGWGLTVRADVAASSKIESVVFTVDGEYVRTENRKPYTLGAEKGSDYNEYPLKQGVRTICATPYSQNYGNGTAGETRCVTLTLNFTLPEHLSADGRYFSKPGSYMFNRRAKGQARYSFDANYDHDSREFTGHAQFYFRNGDLRFRSTNLMHFHQRNFRATLFWDGKIDGVNDYMMEQQLRFRPDKTLVRVRIFQRSSGKVIYDSQRGDDPWVNPTRVASQNDHTFGEPIRTLADQDIELIQEPHIYPNPFRDQLTVVVPENQAEIATFVIVDSSGKRIKQGEVFTGTMNPINTTDMPSGVYVLSLTIADESYNLRVVK